MVISYVFQNIFTRCVSEIAIIEICTTDEIKMDELLAEV